MREILDILLTLMLTPYILFLLFLCGILFLFLYRTIPGNKYSIERGICKVAASVYIALGLVLFIISLVV